ncbi:AAC(3) family N-acetyltransferase [Treponema parvum]|uniref:Aminoglycoside N(3)-acetyltransferase n=1 Tax=Treponema parvum TaxID=138851 RepID=A0A975EZJ1_9SPIR|nr:AAC(3) family N-acetyltransferase [Treponema parvum]QTQ11289.1 AAC(3) family N-acetyltransferase [Treponema parvum]QTQ16771.1 AAC(3) family N-acetyltransferase [Treponema parvum]
MNNFCSGLKEALIELGIKKDDYLYVSSDVRFFLFSAMRNYGTSEEVIGTVLNELTNVLQEAVGSEGTLLFPVFSWDFCSGKGFDYYKTQGEVGAYSNWILNKRKDFKRTQHPLYSFMVWGKKTDLFCNMNNQDAWGVASPFYYLMKNGGKQLEFNCEAFKGLTYIHCIEQWVKVPYRHHKYFFGKYTDANGDTEIRSYSMYCRDLEVSECTKTTNKYLIDNGAAKEVVWNGNKLTLIDISKCYDVTKKDIVENNGENTLCFKNYNFDYNRKQTLPYEISKIPED